jgi:ribosome biogenesis GTPase A
MHHIGKAFIVGAEAGVTRKLTGTVRISKDPSVFVYDTPGVMVPFLGHGEDGAEKGLKFALTAGIKEDLFERDAVVDYLLWRMNRRMVEQESLPKDSSLRRESHM